MRENVLVLYDRGGSSNPSGKTIIIRTRHRGWRHVGEIDRLFELHRFHSDIANFGALIRSRIRQRGELIRTPIAEPGGKRLILDELRNGFRSSGRLRFQP